MPQYYFHLRDKETLKDSVGVDLPGLSEARAHAQSVAKELMFKRDGMLDSGWASWRMSVEDTEGSELLSFVMGDISRDHEN